MVEPHHGFSSTVHVFLQGEALRNVNLLQNCILAGLRGLNVDRAAFSVVGKDLFLLQITILKNIFRVHDI